MSDHNILYGIKFQLPEIPWRLDRGLTFAILGWGCQMNEAIPGGKIRCQPEEPVIGSNTYWGGGYLLEVFFVLPVLWDCCQNNFLKNKLPPG